MNRIPSTTAATGLTWPTLTANEWDTFTANEWDTLSADGFEIGRTFTYDPWNRLKTVSDAATLTQTNTYDGRNYRIIRETTASASTGAETRHCYFTAGWQSLEERFGTATTAERQYVWGLRYIDDVVLRDRDTTANGTLDERFYPTQDANWNVTALVDATGTVQERYAYTSYGVPIYLTPTFGARTTSSYDWQTLFASYRYDPALELFAVRYRTYHPEMGVWLQRDPVGYTDGQNLYTAYFVPKGTDPWGLQQLAPGVPNNLINWDPAVETQDFLWHYEFGGGKHLNIPSSDIVGLLNDADVMEELDFDSVMSEMLKDSGLSCAGQHSRATSGSIKIPASTYGGEVGNTFLSIATDDFHVYGNTVIRVSYSGTTFITCGCQPEQVTAFTFKGTINYIVSDRFANPADIGGPYNEGLETDPYGTPYGFSGYYKTRPITVTIKFPCGSPPGTGCGTNEDRSPPGELRDRRPRRTRRGRNSRQHRRGRRP